MLHKLLLIHYSSYPKLSFRKSDDIELKMRLSGTINTSILNLETITGFLMDSTGRGPGSYTYNNLICNANFHVKGDVELENADCAEEFDAQSGKVNPGTVMVLNNHGILEPSYLTYDKRVAGIVSGAGYFKPAIVLDKQNKLKNNSRVSISLTGKAYCKVDATYSRIETGDLLTTSSTFGHAMKAEDPFQAFGAIIGKALQSVDQGLSLIPVLVALQ